MVNLMRMDTNIKNTISERFPRSVFAHHTPQCQDEQVQNQVALLPVGSLQTRPGNLHLRRQVLFLESLNSIGVA
jgi:hypothetical protein